MARHHRVCHLGHQLQVVETIVVGVLMVRQLHANPDLEDVVQTFISSPVFGET